MPLPNSFGSVTTARGAWLDQNFELVGQTVLVPGLLSGSNTLALAPLGDAPFYGTLENSQAFTGVANNTNTGAATLNVSGLGALPIYKDTPFGPAVLTGGEIFFGNQVTFLYDVALNSGAGGFHLQTGAINQPFPRCGITVITANAGTTLTAAQITGSTTLNAVFERRGAPGAPYNDTTDTAAAILALIPQHEFASCLYFRVVNLSGQTQTLVGGTGVTITGLATTANGAVGHDFLLVVTDATTPLITIYG